MEKLMEVSQKKIKGFTLLELMVVLAIVSVVSAIGFPNFNSWRSEREVRVAAVNLSNLFTEVYSQSQSSSYPFVQVLIDSRNDKILTSGKGISTDKYTKALYNNKNKKLDCTIGDDVFWSEIRMRPFKSTDVLLSFADRVAVCFSKNTSHYAVNAETSSFDGESIILCLKRDMLREGKEICDLTILQNADTNYPAYQLEWSRFGIINLYKYNHIDDAWNLQ